MADVEFDWDPPQHQHGNTRHISRHGLTRVEAEQALTDPYGFDVPAYSTAIEDRYGYVGATETGRLLFVVYTERNERIRVVTAYRAEDEEAEEYYRRRSGPR